MRAALAGAAAQRFPQTPRMSWEAAGRRRATLEGWGQLLLADFVRVNVCTAQSEKTAKVHDPNL